MRDSKGSEISNQNLALLELFGSLVMASRTTASYARRAADHHSRLGQKLFEIADAKKTNITLSADLTTTKELLDITDGMPHLLVLQHGTWVYTIV